MCTNVFQFLLGNIKTPKKPLYYNYSLPPPYFPSIQPKILTNPQNPLHLYIPEQIHYQKIVVDLPGFVRYWGSTTKLEFQPPAAYS